MCVCVCVCVCAEHILVDDVYFILCIVQLWHTRLTLWPSGHLYEVVNRGNRSVIKQGSVHRQ